MGKPKITLEQFKKEVYDLEKDNFIIISEEMKNSKTPILMIHKKCNKEVSIRRDDFLRGRRCKYCSGKNKKTIEEIQLELKSLTDDYLLVSKDYKNNHSELIFYHKQCKREFSSTYTRFFKQGSRCKHCVRESRIIKKTTDEYKKEVYNIYKNEYTVLGEYTAKTHKILMQHNTCGHTWEISPYQFIDRRDRCPACYKIPKNESKYVLMIKEILNENNISYITEKKLCKNPETNRFLLADFFIEDYNLVIEYDGKQHYKPMYNDIKKLEKQKKRDLIKDKYLIKNNINILRIPYTVNTKENIKEIIITKLETIRSV